MTCPSDTFFRRAAFVWCLLVFALIAVAAFSFDRSAVKTDFRSLLPAEETTAQTNELFSAVADNSARHLVVTIGANTAENALRAAELTEKSLIKSGLTVTDADAESLRQTVQFLAPYRNTFLTDQDRHFLETADDAQLLRRALKNLYRPISSVILPWQDDPLGLFANRFQELFTDPHFSVRGRFLTVGSPSDPSQFAVVLNVTAVDTLRLSGTPITDAVRTARHDAQSTVSSAVIKAAGPLLMSEAAASAAQQEASVIGTFSALGVALLVLFFYRTLTPAIWMIVTLGLSFLTAANAVFLVFGEIHLLTLVFGTTLLGIAADYVFHFLTELFQQPSASAARRALFKSLSVSLLTTLAGYSVMLIVPMPILRQMALFCIAGLSAAFCFVMLLGPTVVQSRPMPLSTDAWGTFLGQVLRLSPSKALLLTAILIFAAIPGWFRLQTGDELRLLNSIPAAVLAEQQSVSEKVSPTSPGQFFVIRAKTTDEVLHQLSSLRPRLDRLVNEGLITGYRTGEGPLLPTKRQATDRQLVESVNAEVLRLVEQKLGSRVEMPSATASIPLTLSDWLTSRTGEWYRPFWLSDTETVVFLSGVKPDSLKALQSVAAQLPDVQFIDTTGTIRLSLSHWRGLTIKVLGAAFCLMLVFLWCNYRRQAFFMVLPTAAALLCTVGIQGWLSVPVSLFTVLPMILLLGLGADYAVLLYSKPGEKTALLSVFLAALSTLLSFWLLAFSSTPALCHFGLSLSIGLFLVWFYAMLLHPAGSLGVCHG